MAIGSSSGFSRNESEFFVPDNINGEEYANLFVKELKEIDRFAKINKNL